MSDLLDKHSPDYDPDAFTGMVDDQRKREKENGPRRSEPSTNALDTGGAYDSARRRRSARRDRERGCHIYIAAEELAKTGIDLDGPPPAYRVWADARGRVVVQLYREV